MQLRVPVAQSVQWLCYGLNNRGIMVPGSCKRIFFSSQCPGRLWGPTQHHIQGIFGVLSPEIKRVSFKANRSHPSRLRTNGALTSFPLRLYDVYKNCFACSFVTHLQAFILCSKVLLQKPATHQLAKKFGAFYLNRKFITVFTRGRHLANELTN